MISFNSSDIMFDLKFFQFLHAFLVNLWISRFNTREFYSKGRVSKDWGLKEIKYNRCTEINLWEFIKVYPEYVYWLGVRLFKPSSREDFTDISQYNIYLNDIPLYEYDW